MWTTSAFLIDAWPHGFSEQRKYRVPSTHKHANDTKGDTALKNRGRVLETEVINLKQLQVVHKTWLTL